MESVRTQHGSTVQKAIDLAGEEQAYDWKSRAARSLLGGIGMFDIDQIVEYCKPILTSHTGDVQLETRISGNSNGQARACTTHVLSRHGQDLVRLGSLPGMQQICDKIDV